jgi:hypothetical protein
MHAPRSRAVDVRHLVLSAAILLALGHLLLQIIDKMLRAFLGQHLSRLVRTSAFWHRALSSSRCALVILGSSIVAPYTLAFSRISSINFDA